MPLFSNYPVATLKDVVRFETEKTLEQRYDARSIYDIFAKSAERHPDRTALTMLMTGADDETPRLVTYRQMLDGITRAANFFAVLAGPGAGVAYILPSLVETHFTLWGAETAGYAVPLNFLLQAQNIADLATFCCRRRTSPISSVHPARRFLSRSARIHNSISGKRPLRSASCCRTSSLYKCRCPTRRCRKV